MKVSRIPRAPELGKGNYSATSIRLDDPHILEPFQSGLMSPSPTCPKPDSVSSHQASLEAAFLLSQNSSPRQICSCNPRSAGYELLKGPDGTLTPPYFMTILGIIKSPLRKHVASSCCSYKVLCLDSPAQRQGLPTSAGAQFLPQQRLSKRPSVSKRRGDGRSQNTVLREEFLEA